MPPEDITIWAARWMFSEQKPGEDGGFEPKELMARTWWLLEHRQKPWAPSAKRLQRRWHYIHTGLACRTAPAIWEEACIPRLYLPLRLKVPFAMKLWLHVAFCS